MMSSGEVINELLGINDFVTLCNARRNPFKCITNQESGLIYILYPNTR